MSASICFFNGWHQAPQWHAFVKVDFSGLYFKSICHRWANSLELYHPRKHTHYKFKS